MRGKIDEERMIRDLTLLKKNIKFLRKKANLMTLEEMSKKSGISRDALFKIESAPERYPSIKTVMKIAYFYEVDISDLMEKDLEYEEMKRLAGEDEG